MRTFLVLLAALAPLPGLAPAAHAHFGGQVYFIYELLDEDLDRIDLTDGSVEDWLEVVGEPLADGPRLRLGRSVRRLSGIRSFGSGLPHLARLAPGQQYPLDRHGARR